MARKQKEPAGSTRTSSCEDRLGVRRRRCRALAAMNPKVREALIERLGTKTPTNAQVFAIVRSANYRFKDKEAKALFAKFRAAGRGSKIAPEPPYSAPTPPLDSCENAPDAPTVAPQERRPRTSRAGATRAGGSPSPIPNNEFW